MSRRVVILVSILIAVLLVSVLPAAAQTSQFTVSISSANLLPVGRPTNDSLGCSTLSGGTYYYDLITFVPSVSGTWTYLDSAYLGDTGDLEVNFYTGTFDPANPLANCIASFDDFGTITLTAGVTYTLMVSTHKASTTGTFTFILTSDPPTSGTISAGPTLTPGSPVIEDCGSIDVGTYYYQIRSLTPTVSGLFAYYDLYQEINSLDAVVAVYAVAPAAFDPANPTGNNCVAVLDDEGAVTLTAGTAYSVVVTSYSEGNTGNYQYFLVGPGGAAGVAATCLYSLPEGSLVRSIPAGAPLFYQPDLATQLSYNLPAGTWWTTGTSGEFTRIWIGCDANPVWAPTNAIAP